jgi:hypothetical protein
MRNFEHFIEDVQLLSIGECTEYWHFKVKYEHTKSIWIYYRGNEITIVHDKQEALLILRAMYRVVKLEFEGCI